MGTLLIRRLAAAILLLLLVLTLTFFLIHLFPGDPAIMLAGERGTAESLRRLRHVYGLDRPLAVQYLLWLKAVVLSWDWGSSISQGRPVVRVVGQALGPTLILTGAALGVQYLVGVPLRIGSLLFYSMPLFWLGLMAILLFSFTWPILPASHIHSVASETLGAWASFLDLLRHLVLPALVLGLASAGATVRFVRNRMIEALEGDYVRTARAKGLTERRVVWVHALRNALVPVIQLLGISLPFLLNGSLVLEVVFSWPGLGRTAYQAILARDYPVILAVTALTAALVVAGNFLADVLHAAADPRVRDARG
jgi:peptide/nickel transport system permease protein